MKKLTLGDVCKKESSNIAQKDIMECEGEYPIYGAGGFIKNVNFYQQELPYIAVVKDGAGIGRTMLLPAYSSVIGTMQYILPIDYEIYSIFIMLLCIWIWENILVVRPFHIYTLRIIKRKNCSCQKYVSSRGFRFY